VPVPGRSFLRQRTVPGHGGRPADQPGRQLRVPGGRRRVQHPAVRGPTAVLRQGKVQRMIKTHYPYPHPLNTTMWVDFGSVCIRSGRYVGPEGSFLSRAVS